MNALELQGLTKHYKDFTLGPLDLTLPGGTICGLIGENGAGKSTTIRLILDMVRRDGGTVTIFGLPFDGRVDTKVERHRFFHGYHLSFIVTYFTLQVNQARSCY